MVLNIKLYSAPVQRQHPALKPLPSTDTFNNIPQIQEGLEASQLKLPVSRLPAKQVMLPLENPFDINSELIPHQEKEMEAVFKAPELDDFLFNSCT